MEISFEDSNKFIRMANYNEKNTHGSWLFASCNLDKVSPEQGIKNLKDKFLFLLKNYKILRLILKNENGKLNWYYSENKNLNFDKLVSFVEPPNNSPPKLLPTEPLPLWRISFCPIDNKTNIRIDVNHAITDGRVLFDYLELFSCVANGENLPEKFLSGQGQDPLPPLEINKFFEKSVFDTLKIPDSWKKAILIKLNPEVKLPSYAICDQWEFEFSPFKKFCEKYKVTIQGIISASQSRAIWNYHNGKYDDMELGIYTPIDIRKLKYTKEEIKNRLFQVNISNILPFVKKKKTIMDQIMHCQEEMLKSYKSFEGGHAFITLYNLMDLKTQVINYNIPEFPDNSSKNIVFASHIGRVPDRENMRYGLFMPVLEWGYWPNIYAFHNSKIIYFTFERPYNVDNKYVESVHNSIVEIYEFIKSNI